MPIGNGGIIGVANNPTSTTATGVWSLQEQYKAKKAGNWPLPATPFSVDFLVIAGGGGAGGSGGYAGAAGGSGIVIIRYPSATQTATGGTVTSYTYNGVVFQCHTFTTSGTFTA